MPKNALVYLDGTLLGPGPIEHRVAPGDYTLSVAAEGYEADQRRITVCDPLSLHIVLQDIEPPTISLQQLPDAVVPEAGLKVAATASDNSGIEAMRVMVDGVRVAHATEGIILHNLDTRELALGPHTIRIEAQDAAGNAWHVESSFDVALPTSTLIPSGISPSPAVTAVPTHSPPQPPLTRAPPPTPTHIATHTPTPLAPGVPTARWHEVAIDAYAYEEALYTDPAIAGHPYPLIARESVGPPRPVGYRALTVENEYLSLTWLPDLGGRLYQCVYRPTGQPLLYNNRVIKPSPWGPEDQGWWLAVGGVEYALPVHEHGYLSALPWDCALARGADGSLSVQLSTEEQTRGLYAAVTWTLAPNDASVALDTFIENRSGTRQHFQFWVNALVSPGSHGVGSSLRLFLPAESVIVHSTGDNDLPGPGAVMPWPMVDSRDLSDYGTWDSWLGVFAKERQGRFVGAYDLGSDIGLARVFPDDLPGIKLFGFGKHFGDTIAYTDDGSQYVELWTGASPTFWDDTDLDAGETLGWHETWMPVHHCSGISAANEHLALHAVQEGDDLAIQVYSPRVVLATVKVLHGQVLLHQEARLLAPNAVYRLRLPVPGGNRRVPVVVEIMDAAGRSLLSHAIYVHAGAVQ